MRRGAFDSWYRRAQHAFPGKLPPRRQVRLVFDSLRGGLARIEYDQMMPSRRVRNVRITIHRSLRRQSKLCFREVAHELTHLIRPDLRHGSQFERFIVRVKVAMDKDPGWY